MIEGRFWNIVKLCKHNRPKCYVIYADEPVLGDWKWSKYYVYQIYNAVLWSWRIILNEKEVKFYKYPRFIFTLKTKIKDGPFGVFTILNQRSISRIITTRHYLKKNWLLWSIYRPQSARPVKTSQYKLTLVIAIGWRRNTRSLGRTSGNKLGRRAIYSYNLMISSKHVNLFTNNNKDEVYCPLYLIAKIRLRCKL